MDSIKSVLPSSSSAPSSEEESEDNIFTYLLSFIGFIFTFTYDNFAYISGIMLVMFGILVYIDMTKIDLSSQPMGRSKTVVIEGMVNNNNAAEGDNAGGDNPGLKNDLITKKLVNLKILNVSTGGYYDIGEHINLDELAAKTKNVILLYW